MVPGMKRDAAGDKAAGAPGFAPDADGRLLDRPDVHRFGHPAMATIFEAILFSDDGEEYAAQAAQEAFRVVDRLEIDLSCHLSNSDIGRINRTPAGGRVTVGIDAFSCLSRALEWRNLTAGAFDPDLGGVRRDETAGRATPVVTNGAERVGAPRAEGAGFVLDADRFEVLVLRPVRIDLGAIGKGFAVDRMAEIFLEWEIEAALVHGGRSSVYGYGSPPGFDGWPVVLHHPVDRGRELGRFLLNGRGMGASGLEKGPHIVDPRTGDPATHRVAAWVLADDAASADAASTALMVMGEEEAALFLEKHPEIEAVLA
jgi:FAD:protein FMN transferase